MNSDTFGGTATDLGGKIKETAGDATGDNSLKGEGLADQLGGKAQKALGSAKEALSGGAAPIVNQVKGFAKDRPFTAAAVAGVLGIALLNTLRGKK